MLPLAVYVPERDVYVDHADKDNGIVVCCSSSSSRMKVVQSVSDNIIIARWAIHYNMTLTQLTNLIAERDTERVTIINIDKLRASDVR